MSPDRTVYADDSQVATIDGVDMGYIDRGNTLRTTAGATSFTKSPLGCHGEKEGTNITYYLRDPNGSILASYGAGGKLFYFSEFHGSVAAGYSTGGTEVGAYSYSPYGKTTVTGASGPSNPFRYIGGLQDKDSSGSDTYYNLGARYYDAQGHFTQPDPIVPGGGSYSYTEGDPINSSDPSGLTPGDADDHDLCGTQESTGYYVPNCGGYITGGGGGQPFGQTAGCTGAGLAEVGAYLAGAVAWGFASVLNKVGSLITPVLAIGVGEYNPFQATAAICN